MSKGERQSKARPSAALPHLKLSWLCTVAIAVSFATFAAMILLMLPTALLLRSQFGLRLESGFALLAVATIFLASGIRIAAMTIAAVAGSGTRVVRERPVYSAAWLLLSMILTALGGTLAVLVVRGYFLNLNKL